MYKPTFPPHSSPTSDTWRGWTRHRFTLDQRECFLVPPRNPAPGMPWIWRARFFDAWPNVDLALLERGFHLVYIDVANLYGCPRAVSLWDNFYAYLVETHKLAPKAVLEGMSRGGLIVYNWAASNPDKVACIYADAPVCDIRSWPGGKGKGSGSPENWEKCLAAYGLNEEEAMSFASNPIDRLEPLARANIPLLHVCGNADEVVPISENTGIVEERYRKLGGRIKVIIKPGCGHHPHSLDNVDPIVDFILQSLSY